MATDEQSVQTAKYFCVGNSCDAVPGEVPRDAGLDLYQPDIESSQTALTLLVPETAATDDRPMCWCINAAAGGSYYCPAQLRDLDDNNADTRVDTGCQYFGGNVCPEFEGYSGIGHFGPISCEGNFEDKRIETGFDLYGDGAVVGVEGVLAMGYYGPAVRPELNLSDDRTDSGCQYYSTGPCIDVARNELHETGADEEEQEEEEEEETPVDDYIPPEDTQVKYYCPTSCENIIAEKVRDPGCKDFGPGSCEDLLKRKHELFLRGEQEDNSSDVRRHTGCVYFSIYDSCIEVVRPPEPGKFGPGGYEDDDDCETRMQTGCLYFGGGPCVDRIPWDEEAEEAMGYFGPKSCEENSSDVRTATGLEYFTAMADDELSRPAAVRDESLFGPEGFEDNNENVRTVSGVQYFRPWSPELEAVVKTREDEFGFTGEPDNTCDIRMETGEMYYGPGPDVLPSESQTKPATPQLTLEHGDNTSDVRTSTGCKFFSGVSCFDIIAMRELTEVRYFCPRDCNNVDIEVPREGGQRYFDPLVAAEMQDDYGGLAGGDKAARVLEMEFLDAVKYFCQGSCENIAVEQWRDSGCRYYGPESCEGASEYFGPGGSEDNAQNIRVVSGCRMYGGRRKCIEVVGEGVVAQCFDWTVEQVADWIESIGFKKYRDCFERNAISGRRLILIDASSLPKIGVRDFEHVKLIAREIRDLLYVDPVEWNRSIALPPKDERSLFLDAKCITGRHADKLTFATFHDDFEHIKFQPPLSNHAKLLPPN